MIKRIVAVLGTRPEAIKVLPVVRALRAFPEEFDCVVLATSQHRELLEQALEVFGIGPDVDLKIMTEAQTLTDISTRVLEGLGRYLENNPADLVLVQGDTTTSFAAALAAFYRQIPVGHIEAGLRTSNRYSPFPEEMNRCLTSRLASLHFAPSAGSAANLLGEGVPAESVTVTGNTVIDAVLEVVDRRKPLPEDLEDAIGGHRIIMVTAHRRENHGAPLREALEAIRELVARHPDTCAVYPVHPNPNVVGPAFDILDNVDRICLTPPLNYLDFVALMSRSYLLITDSGGLQEEAPALGKPVLVLREETERPEAVEAGTAILVGCDREKILRQASLLLTDTEEYDRMSYAHNPYGDGTASSKIVAAIRDFLA